ncbi:MAG: UvrD-helicase domain-containing protein, partial [Chlorobi bacterium]|nr:UvrD-helicase domain-containing protein [Chlorobiota bacterium]
MKDTAEQSLAQSFDRHLSVTANAGSGKTRVLENRYINLLMNADINNDPRKITAITFTRKAASEILIRIADNLDDKYRNAESIRESQKILRIREKLQSAPISTIHSFCSSLLRDFPIEADINPNFAEINDADKIRITGEAINNLFEDYLEGDDGQRELIKNIFGLYGRSKVETYIRNLLNHSELMPVIIDFYDNNSDEKIIQIRDKAAIAKVRASLEAALEHLSFVIDNIDEELFHDLKRNKKKAIDGYAEVKALYSIQLDSAGKIDWSSVAIENLIDICSNIIEIKKLLYKKSGPELFKHWSDCCND